MQKYFYQHGPAIVLQCLGWYAIGIMKIYSDVYYFGLRTRIYTYVIYVYAATYISKWFAKQPWGNCARLKLEKLPRSCSPVSIHNCYIPLSKGGKTLMKCRDNECINFRCASICGIQPSPVFVYYQIFGWFYVEIGSKNNFLEVSDVITR